MRVILVIGLVVIVSCQNPAEDVNIFVFDGKKISISYPDNVNHNDWLKIDDLLFVHKSDYKPEELGGITRDSVLSDGNILKYYPLPASQRYFELENGERKSERIISTVIMSEIVEHLSQINAKNPKYLMNLGANLWLNNTLELSESSGQRITIKSNFQLGVKVN